MAANYAVGAALLLLVDVLWTSSNYLSSSVLTHGYDKPFAVTYLNTASFALYLVPFAVMYLVRVQPGKKNDDILWWHNLGFYLPLISTAESETLLPPPEPVQRVTRPSRPVYTKRPSSIDGRRPRSDLSVRLGRTDSYDRVLSTLVRGRSRPRIDPEAVDSDASDNNASDMEVSVVRASELPPLSVVDTALLSVEFAIVWFVANWSFIAALGYTSVASCTTLGSTSGFFTLVLGSLCGVDAFSPAKLGSVTLRCVPSFCSRSFFGVVLIAWADRYTTHLAMAPSHPLLGDTLALISALCYAGYVTLLKVRIGSEDRISMPLFLGFVGAFNIVAFWPLGLALHMLDIERFEVPQDAIMWSGVLVNMLITVFSDFAYLVAMLKSSPLFTTVGLSLTIPMAVIGDSLRDPSSLSLQSAIGSVLVLVCAIGSLLTPVQFCVHCMGRKPHGIAPKTCTA